MSFSTSLKNIRKENNLSQEELAVIMNVSRQSISKYEQGTTYPEIDKLIILSRKFNITIDSLLNIDDSELIENKNKISDTGPKTITNLVDPNILLNIFIYGIFLGVFSTGIYYIFVR